MTRLCYTTAGKDYGNIKGWRPDGEQPYDHFGALLSREELGALTGTKQPKRMCAWLESRGWAHELPARRGDIPKVLRVYRDARLSGLKPENVKKANYSFMTAGQM